MGLYVLPLSEGNIAPGKALHLPNMSRFSMFNVMDAGAFEWDNQTIITSEPVLLALGNIFIEKFAWGL